MAASSSVARAAPQLEPPPTPRKHGKRRVALLCGYDGLGFHGSQMAGGDEPPTVERALLDALAGAGLLGDPRNAEHPAKVGLSRASRTDRGVHAAGNVFAVKLRVPPDAFGANQHAPAVVDATNARLPPGVRLFSAVRVAGGFSAYADAVARAYHYVLPAGALHSGGAAGRFRGDDATALAALNATLAQFAGTHSFHNFTAPRLRSGALTAIGPGAAALWAAARLRAGGAMPAGSGLDGGGGGGAGGYVRLSALSAADGDGDTAFPLEDALRRPPANVRRDGAGEDWEDGGDPRAGPRGGGGRRVGATNVALAANEPKPVAGRAHELSADADVTASPLADGCGGGGGGGGVGVAATTPSTVGAALAGAVGADARAAADRPPWHWDNPFTRLYSAVFGESIVVNGSESAAQRPGDGDSCGGSGGSEAAAGAGAGGVATPAGAAAPPGGGAWTQYRAWRVDGAMARTVYAFRAELVAVDGDGGVVAAANGVRSGSRPPLPSDATLAAIGARLLDVDRRAAASVWTVPADFDADAGDGLMAAAAGGAPGQHDATACCQLPASTAAAGVAPSTVASGGGATAHAPPAQHREGAAVATAGGVADGRPAPARRLLRLTVHASGFMFNQIRYMVGAAVGVHTGALRPDAIAAALTLPIAPHPPRAPAEGLLMAEAHFADNAFVTWAHTPGTPDDAVPVPGYGPREAHMDDPAHAAPLDAATRSADAALVTAAAAAARHAFAARVLLPRLLDFTHGGGDSAPSPAAAWLAALPSEAPPERVQAAVSRFLEAMRPSADAHAAWRDAADAAEREAALRRLRAAAAQRAADAVAARAAAAAAAGAVPPPTPATAPVPASPRLLRVPTHLQVARGTAATSAGDALDLPPPPAPLDPAPLDGITLTEVAQTLLPRGFATAVAIALGGAPRHGELLDITRAVCWRVLEGSWPPVATARAHAAWVAATGSALLAREGKLLFPLERAGARRALHERKAAQRGAAAQGGSGTRRGAVLVEPTATGAPGSGPPPRYGCVTGEGGVARAAATR